MQNPKYANVKSTINTGATAKNATVYSKFVWHFQKSDSNLVFSVELFDNLFQFS